MPYGESYGARARTTVSGDGNYRVKLANEEAVAKKKRELLNKAYSEEKKKELLLLKERQANSEKLTKEEERKLNAYYKKERECEQEALKFAEECHTRLLATKTVGQRKHAQESLLAEQKHLQARITSEKLVAIETLKRAKTDKERNEAKKKLLALEASEKTNKADMVESQNEILRLHEMSLSVQMTHLSKAERLKFLTEEAAEITKAAKEEELRIEAQIKSAQAEQESIKDKDSDEYKILAAHIEALNEQLAGVRNVTSAQIKSSDEARKETKNPKGKNKEEQKQATKEKIDARVQEMAKDSADRSAEEKEEAKAKMKYKYGTKEGWKETGKEVGGKAVQAVADFVANLSAAIDSNIKSFYEYQSSIEARLQGSEESYKESLKNVAKNVGLSGLVSQKEVVNNIKTLVEAGVAYNVDLRAFLQTVKDDIATTFDAFDSNLLRLIRIQQADTTAARLGMEASLTKLFNEFFSDSSYLSDAFDNVAASIIDASSQLTRDTSLAFEHTVQKWLGSLYSVGVSDSAVNSIAQGLNYLGTGNVDALTSNDALMTLLAMSASRSGHNLGDILNGGLDAEITNDLMKGMIEYLKEIANNTDNNQVTKSAYANLFGLSTTDINSINNLSTDDINNLFSQALTYTDAISELNNQFSQISNRVHLSQVLDTVYENAVLSAATGIGNSQGLYTTWLVTNLIEGLTGGIALPFVNVMGFGVDLNTTVTGLIKTGLAGAGLMSSLLSSMASGNLFGNMSLDGWGYDEYTARGGSRKAISKGVSQGLSESSTMTTGVSTSSSSDMQSTALTDATSDAEETSKITNANHETDADIYTKIYDNLGGDDQILLDLTGQIVSLLAPDRTFLTSLPGFDNLLGAKRVFYVSMVDMLPTASNSFVSSANDVLELSSLDHTIIDAVEQNAETTTSSLLQQLTNSTSKLSTIDELHNMNLASISSSNNGLLTEAGLKVAVTELSPEIQKFLIASISAAAEEIVKETTAGLAQTSGEEGEAPLVTAIREALSDGVKISNFGADEAFTKAATALPF